MGEVERTANRLADWQNDHVNLSLIDFGGWILKTLSLLEHQKLAERTPPESPDSRGENEARLSTPRHLALKPALAGEEETLCVHDPPPHNVATTITIVFPPTLGTGA
jgi:hypothetical protein